MPGIIPPDPGFQTRNPDRALALAKITKFDRGSGGFRLNESVRWLRVEGEKLIASASAELLVSVETHEILTHGRRKGGELDPSGHVFFCDLAGREGLYQLEENGFEARAVPA